MIVEKIYLFIFNNEIFLYPIKVNKSYDLKVDKGN